MSRTIWKYPLDIGTTTLPVTMARPIHIGLDPQGQPCIWIEVDLAAQTTDLIVSILGTGHPIPEGVGEHFVSFTDGPFVWHAYIAGAGVTL